MQYSEIHIETPRNQYVKQIKKTAKTSEKKVSEHIDRDSEEHDTLLQWGSMHHVQGRNPDKQSEILDTTKCNKNVRHQHPPSSFSLVSVFVFVLHSTVRICCKSSRYSAYFNLEIYHNKHELSDRNWSISSAKREYVDKHNTTSSNMFNTRASRTYPGNDLDPKAVVLVLMLLLDAIIPVSMFMFSNVYGSLLIAQSVEGLERHQPTHRTCRRKYKFEVHEFSRKNCI